MISIRKVYLLTPKKFQVRIEEMKVFFCELNGNSEIKDEMNFWFDKESIKFDDPC